MSAVVIVPTYNERENIERITEQILARPADVSMLVVDDGSPDGTGDLVRGLMTKYPDRVDLLERSGKHGLGRAYIAGFERVLAEGRHDVILQMDADGSHDPVDIDRLIAAKTADVDLVLGSRYASGGGVDGWSKGREVLSRSGNFYARTMLGTRLHDITGGFRAWNAELLSKLDAATTHSEGYAFQIEIAMRAVALGANVVEVPIIFHERVAGTSKMSVRIASEALFGLPAMRRELRSGNRR